MKDDIPSSDADSDRAIDDAVETWFGLYDSGELSAAQKAELAEWLEASPRHRRAFARLTRGSRRLDELAVLRPARAKPDPELRLRGRRGGRKWQNSILAIAAAAIVAMAGFSRWRGAVPPDPHVETAATEVGGLRTMTLSDGSMVTLNTRTVLEIAFTPAERRTRLVQGEAVFTVTKDAARPFIVQAGDVAVQAVGTAFNVRRDARAVEVLVTEGRIRVSDSSGKSLLGHPDRRGAGGEASNDHEADGAVLAAGQRVIIPVPRLAKNTAASPTIVTVTTAEIARSLAWQEKRLEFEPTPLGEIVAEFNRYNAHQLVVKDPVIAGIKVGGSFPADDYVTFVRLLESSFGIAVERGDRETFLRKAAAE